MAQEEQVGLPSEKGEDVVVCGESKWVPEPLLAVKVDPGNSYSALDASYAEVSQVEGEGGGQDGAAMDAMEEDHVNPTAESPEVSLHVTTKMVNVEMKEEVNVLGVGDGAGSLSAQEGEITATATATAEAEVPQGRKKRKRRQKTVVEVEVEEQGGMGRRSKRPSRQHAKVSTYDESALDVMIEEQIEGISTRSRSSKGKFETVEKGMTMEAMIAAAMGFPRESLTEEEIAACVVSTIGGAEQENYIVVRNHILAKWRENVTVWLEQETVMEAIRSMHSKLVTAAYKFLSSHGYINFGVAPAITARMPALKEKASVVIVGAGLAGLGAARHLMALGHRVIVLEGRQRAGGRVYTKKMEVENIFAAADLGGSVVTGMHGNPLGVLARQMNWPLHKIRDKCPIYQPNGQPAVDEVDKKVEAEFNQLLDTCSKWRESNQVESGKVSLGRILEVLRVGNGMGSNPAERQLFDWHFANLEYANASLLTNLSLSNWDQDDPYEMGGDHCFLPGGNVQFVEALSENVPIFFGKTVLKIRHTSEGVEVETVNQVFKGDMALCTVPLGVLKKRMISFEPPLPQYKVDAIDRLGFGLLNKVVMLFPKVFWEKDIDTFGHLEENPKKRGEYFMFYSYAAVAGGPLLVALVAGEAAIEFERTPPLEAVTRVMCILRGIFEPKGVKVPNPVQTVCTRWGSDSLCYGSYSNVAVGASGEDYDIMAQPVGDRLFFAGEATNRKYPATMHGALLSGHREAANMARAALVRLETSTLEKPVPRNVQSYNSVLVDLFKEPDLQFGNFSVILNQQTEEPTSLGLLRMVYQIPSTKGAGVLAENASETSTTEEQLFLYTTITRQQAFELRKLTGDKERLQHLCIKFGVKLVGRKGLGPEGDALVVSIKWNRNARKANSIQPASSNPTKKHQALVQLRSGVSTRKVAALVGMSQSFVAHLRKDVREEIERQRGGRPKLLTDRERRRCVTLVTEGRLGTASATAKQFRSETGKLLSDITVRRALKEAELECITSVAKEAVFES